MPEDSDTLFGASEALYRSLIEQVPAVVYVDSNDRNHETLYVSPQSEAVLGRRPDEFLADRDLRRRCIHPGDLDRVVREWSDAIQRQDRFESEYRWRRPDGTVLWVRDGSVLVRNGDGRPLFWQGVIHDIAASKRAEDAYRESAARYRFLVENIPAVVYMVAPDVDRRTLYVSPHVERALGYTRREWLEQPDIWMELLHPDDREPTLAAQDRHNETGEPWSREYRLIASDGRAVWIRDVANLIRDERGRALRWLGVQLDITELKLVEEELRAARDELEGRVRQRTADLEMANELMSLEIAERRRAEEELRATEQQFRALAERIPAVTYIWQSDRDPGAEDHSYTSPRIEQLLGFGVAEWHRPEFRTSRFHPDDRARVIAATLRSETTGEPFSMEYRYLHKDGHIVWVLDEAALLSRDERGRPDLFQGVMVDITARKEAEDDATENELRFRALAEHAPAITYVVDLSRRGMGDEVTYVSPQITSMLGYTREDWSTSAGWLATVHPDDRERVEQLATRFHTGDESYVLEYRIVSRDGIVRWVRDQGGVLSRDALGSPKRLQGLIVDVTSARQAEQDRLQAEARYRSLVEQIPAVTYIELPSDDPGAAHLVYLSPQAEEVFGRTPGELIADPRHLEHMLHPEDRDRVLVANAESERTGEAFDEEFRIVRDDGREVWVHSRATLVRDDDGGPLFWHGISLDVTAQRKAEASLRDLEIRYEELVVRVEQAEGTGTP
ncbi:MAG: PAS domain-containing protein [Actinomycetota bacterium]